MGGDAKAKREQRKRAAASRKAVSDALSKFRNVDGAGGQRGVDGSLAVTSSDVLMVQEAPLGPIAAQFDAMVTERAAASAAAEAARGFPVPGSTATEAGASEAAGGEQRQKPVPGQETAGKALDGVVASKKERRRDRMAQEIIRLKGSVQRPDLVDRHDVNAQDPIVLLALKAARNTITVPRHWAKASLFLKDQNSRDVTDAVVPSFVDKTGVADIRPAAVKISIDAISRLALPFTAGHAPIPLTKYGDVFYEGKELNTRSFRPGVTSDALREALRMGPTDPPPWLYGMQALKKLPPGHPGVKLPGMNAPLPRGASWGNQQGKWGEPVRRSDESGTLMWPDCLSHAKPTDGDGIPEMEEPVGLWGALPDAASAAVVFADPATSAPVAAPPEVAAQAAQPVETAVPAFTTTTNDVRASIDAQRATARHAAPVPMDMRQVATAGFSDDTGNIVTATYSFVPSAPGTVASKLDRV